MSKGNKQEAEEGQREPSAIQERLNWQLAWRDDRRVAQALYGGEEIEEMHELSEAGLLDEFFVFLEQVGMMAVLEQMHLPGPDVLRPQLVGRLVEVLGEGLHRPDVRLYGSLRVITTLEFLQHHFSKMGHGDLLSL